MGTTGPRSQTRALNAHARAAAVVHVDIQILGGFVGSVSACQLRVRTLADVRCHALARDSPESTAPARPREGKNEQRILSVPAAQACCSQSEELPRSIA